MFPTRVPTAAPTPTPVARSDDSELIARLLGNIENAILTRNLGAYRSYVDLTTDPIFGLEHNRWIEDMETRVRILRYDLTMRNLTIDGDEATRRPQYVLVAVDQHHGQLRRGLPDPVPARDGRPVALRRGGLDHGHRDRSLPCQGPARPGRHRRRTAGRAARRLRRGDGGPGLPRRRASARSSCTTTPGC